MVGSLVFLDQMSVPKPVNRMDSQMDSVIGLMRVHKRSTVWGSKKDPLMDKEMVKQRTILSVKVKVRQKVTKQESR